MDSILNKRSKFARQRAGFRTQAEAAKAIGCSRPAVVRWETEPTATTIGRYLLAAARAYKVRPEWLLLESDNDGYPWKPKTGEIIPVNAYEIRGVDGSDGVNPTTEVMIPVYDIEVSGGPGLVVPEYVETKYKLPYQIEWLKRMDARPEDILISKVRGESMEPVLFNEDKIVVHLNKRRIIDDTTYFVIHAGEARVKKLFKQANGGIRLVSNNPDKYRFPDEIVTASNAEDFFIIGQVIDKMGPGGL